MKRGFTLIELLAVILILGIIALIAIPTVNNIIKESRRGAFSSTLTNLEKAIEEKCTLEQIKNLNITTTYTIINGKISPDVDIKGDLPDGTIYVDKDCNVTYTLYNNNHTGIKEKDKEVQILDGTIYLQNVLNGAQPVLDIGMIPVIIENDGSVKKASLLEKWYDYSNKMWANAVVVNQSEREKYQNAKPGTTILETDIKGYFVWIPRYKYAISEGEGPRTINIVFENKYQEKSTGTAIGEDYYTHPGFSFGNDELNGIWVGKFETTGTNTSPTILPNQTAITNYNTSQSFYITRLFESDTYGISSDAHMMKNTEWGAVAYLSHSKYGINGEVRNNNNSEYITGCGASTADKDAINTCEIQYGNASSYPQATNGNITGVFDMNGGAWERLMDVRDKIIYSSGFNPLPEEKYFNNYTTSDFTTACNGPCKGHANYETQNWYSDNFTKGLSNGPWNARGGCNSSKSSGGLFSSLHGYGGAAGTTGFRVVIAPST